jgi:hypothetical protein
MPTNVPCAGGLTVASRAPVNVLPTTTWSGERWLSASLSAT